ncbi:MAG: DUF1015 domain-containing protein [Ignavibacteria bacterium]|nr:DUF1015 domain-containing protein [Ignavibacteria bacterium]
MPQFLPFKGILYNPKKVSFDNVVSPPYDVIGNEYQQELYERDAYNFVKIDFPKEEERYDIAYQRLKEWESKNIFVQDAEPTMYLMEQQFTAFSGSHTRRGIIGLCKLEELSEHSTIRRHEKTFPKPKEDRLRLLETTSTHLSQVFSFFSETEFLNDEHFALLCPKSPLIEFEFENVTTKLWRITDSRFHQQVNDKFQSLTFVLADGHHRYETALEYQRMMKKNNPHHNGNEGYNYVMMYATNMVNEGLVVLPTHRIVEKQIDIDAFLHQLHENFIVKYFFSLHKLLKGVQLRKYLSFGIVLKDSPIYYLVNFKDERKIREWQMNITPDLQRLDVSIVHNIFLEKFLTISQDEQSSESGIEYVRNPSDISKKINNDNAQIAFILNPPSINQVYNVAVCGSTMPQKSTYFFPKLPSGTVLFDTNNF